MKLKINKTNLKYVHKQLPELSKVAYTELGYSNKINVMIMRNESIRVFEKSSYTYIIYNFGAVCSSNNPDALHWFICQNKISIYYGDVLICVYRFFFFVYNL